MFDMLQLVDCLKGEARIENSDAFPLRQRQAKAYRTRE